MCGLISDGSRAMTCGVDEEWVMRYVLTSTSTCDYVLRPYPLLPAKMEFTILAESSADFCIADY